MFYNNPVAEVMFDIWVSQMLNVYYWPLYLAGKEDAMSQNIKKLLRGNICFPR